MSCKDGRLQGLSPIVGAGGREDHRDPLWSQLELQRSGEESWGRLEKDLLSTYEGKLCGTSAKGEKPGETSRLRDGDTFQTCRRPLAAPGGSSLTVLPECIIKSSCFFVITSRLLPPGSLSLPVAGDEGRGSTR